MKPTRAIVRLSITLNDGQPPSEFRIFAAGKVETTIGTFTFDAEAAAMVLAAYKAHGIELMVDYAHASLGADSSPDPSQAGKAAAWFELDVRNGELWATNVRWTPPAFEALERREWRFMSPAFTTDEDGRITELLNVAITNLPATRKLQPLMAAARGTNMADSPKGLTLAEALSVAKALGLDPASTTLSDLLAKLTGNGPAAPDSTDDLDPAVAAADNAKPSPPAPGPDKMQPAAASRTTDTETGNPKALSLSRAILAMTGKSDEGEAFAELARRSQVAVDLEKREQQLSRDRATLESGERRGLVAQLVKLGFEVPATAWQDDKGTVPAKHLQGEPIADLRARVAKLSAARPAKKDAFVEPPTGALNALGLTEDELKICSDLKCPPENFAKLKADRDSVKKGG